MAEAVVFGIAQKVLTDLGSLALQEIGTAVGVTHELNRLEKTVSTINAVLLDAEDEYLNNREISLWLRRMKDAAYEADDILEEFASEALRRKFVSQDSSMKLVRNFFSSSNVIVFRFRMGHKIKDIREKLDDIAADKNKFHLTERVREETRVHAAGREPTHSFIVESGVFGRDRDREEIVELVLGTDGEDNFSVVVIQGLGGIGKTTLAQLVYNDKRVVGVFEPKIWVCVSEGFTVEKLIKKIIESATKDECPQLAIDLLQSRLRDILKEKRFLIVLDDVWDENSDKWYRLKYLLNGGARGSKIIVTTRSERVSFIMSTVPNYPLKKLSEIECRKLFKQWAFPKGQEHPDLVAIGDDIVNKCCGVPLAAKMLGSALSYQTEKREWLRVKNSDLWRLPEGENEVMPALRLSYNHLSFSLKQCFAYCAIFPKNHRIKKEVLIQLWIAQGFVHSSDQNHTLEDVGNNCVKDLWYRSFLQEPVVDYYGNLVSFKLHDLMHDLAQSVAGTDCAFVGECTGTIPLGVRHVYLDSSTLWLLQKPLNLRTLVIQSEHNWYTHIPHNVILKFRSLRVLVLNQLEGKSDFSKFRKWKHLVGSSDSDSSRILSKLKQLRYLELYSSSVTTVPESITRLQNLQTLRLPSNCLIQKLPTDIGKMINLRHVYIGTCFLLSHMPLGLEKLISLQTLPLFVVGKDIGCKLNALGPMIHLGGKLSIRNLEYVRSATDSIEANLKGKQNLEILKLLWNKVDDGNVTVEEIAKDVLQSLQPHPNLRKLKVEGYGDTSFPHWMMNPLLPNIVKIYLLECKCLTLPPFGDLPSLKVLKLVGMESLQFIEGESGSGIKWFPSLEILSLERVLHLEKWATRTNVQTDNNSADGRSEMRSLLSLPCLVELSLYDCPKLTAMPKLPSLEKLHIEKCCQKLVNSLLKVVSRDSLSSSLAKLKLLKIAECDDLVCFSGTRYLTALQSLHLSKCKEMHILEGMHELASLQTLVYGKLYIA